MKNKEHISNQSMEKKSPFPIEGENTITNPSSSILTQSEETLKNKKRKLIKQYLLDNFISKKQKLIILYDNNQSNNNNSNIMSGATPKTSKLISSVAYKKINSFENYGENNNNIIIIDHEKINISNLKYKDLHNLFHSNFKNWMLINNKIWKNNRTQIKKIRIEDKKQKKKNSISFKEQEDEETNKEKKEL